METGNRRMLRPHMDDLKEKMDKSRILKKPAPSDQTNAENFYYVKQIQSKTPMVLVLKGGASVHGVIEWYDRDCIRIARDEGASLLVYKSNIAYMYKDEGS
ncbi:MAG: RNA chaperone Hfq [Acidobacteria bacterium]|nr:RNA chaperone Hfq [Acidobacteriota bacterium]